MVSDIHRIKSPTEVDHYQLRRTIDIYVAPARRGSRPASRTRIDGIIAHTKVPEGPRVTLRGMVQAMRAFVHAASAWAYVSPWSWSISSWWRSSDRSSIRSSFCSPCRRASPGVILTLLLTGTTLNVMSLMGVVMMVGIVVSNSILIVEFTHHLREEGMAVREAVAIACRVRLRPVLMTSLATIIGLIPMALKLGAGSEAYAPLARAIIGGLTVSVAADGLPGSGRLRPGIG